MILVLLIDALLLTLTTPIMIVMIIVIQIDNLPIILIRIDSRKIWKSLVYVQIVT